MKKSLQDSVVGDWHQRSDCDYQFDYDSIFRDVAGMRIVEAKSLFRQLCKDDLFFLLVFGLQRFDANKPFVVDYINRIQSGPDTGTLDLVPREHYKSTVRSYAQVIQDIIKDPEITVGFFSHTRPAAKKFAFQIMQMCEGDYPVKKWFDDVFWDKPRTEAPRWSLDEGLILKRKGTPKEASIEAWGLLDGQPTGSHYKLRVYDDVEVKESTSTSEQIKKLRDQYQASHSLGMEGGRYRISGTFWHHAGLMVELRDSFPSNNVILIDGWSEKKDAPVMLSREYWDNLKGSQSPYIFACNYRMKPVTEENREFDRSKVRRFRRLPGSLNLYLLCDPAHSKKKGSDYTVYLLIGIDDKGYRYLVDGIRKRLDLTGRWKELKELCKDRKILRGGYERYGLQADTEYFEEKQKEEGVYLPPIKELGGKISKEERIRRLKPIINGGQFFVPEYGIMSEGFDLVAEFFHELDSFPFSKHDDILDAASRLEDEEMGKQAPNRNVSSDMEEEDGASRWQRKAADLYDMV